MSLALYTINYIPIKLIFTTQKRYKSTFLSKWPHLQSTSFRLYFSTSVLKNTFTANLGCNPVASNQNFSSDISKENL